MQVRFACGIHFQIGQSRYFVHVVGFHGRLALGNQLQQFLLDMICVPWAQPNLSFCCPSFVFDEGDFFPFYCQSFCQNNYTMDYIISVTHGLRCIGIQWQKSSLYAHNCCKARLPVRHQNCVPCWNFDWQKIFWWQVLKPIKCDLKLF